MKTSNPHLAMDHLHGRDFVKRRVFPRKDLSLPVGVAAPARKLGEAHSTAKVQECERFLLSDVNILSINGENHAHCTA